MNAPRLAEVNCTKVQFQPGQRLLVRVWHSLTIPEQDKLKKTIKRWVGTPDVEILIIDARKMEIEIEHGPSTGLSFST